MKHHLTTLSFAIVFLFALNNCAGKTISTPTSPEPSIQPVTTSPTMIVKNTLTLSPTSTFKATQTLAWPSPTPFLLKTKFPKACQDVYFDEWTKISPSGDWLAESCDTDGTMQVSTQDGTKVFTINSKDYFNFSDPNLSDLSGSVKPVHWTNDSLFIYFTVTPEQWNDGAFMMTLDVYRPLLARMNIENGETAEIFRGTFYHSFSPTDRRLIEIQESEHPTRPIIHDLKTGTTQTLIPNNDSKYSQAANVVWSPDGLKFVFVAAFGADFGDEVNEYNIQSLILVDTANLSQRIIVSKTSDLIKPISWDENDLVTYQIWNYENRNQITTYSYDYQKEKAEISAIPTIAP